MGFLESAATWNFTSTGTGKYMPVGTAQFVSVGVETSSGCTATVQILHKMGSTTGQFNILSTQQCTIADVALYQKNGPLGYIAPRVVDKTAGGATNTITVHLKGV